MHSEECNLFLEGQEKDMSGGPSFWSVIERIGKAGFIDLNQPVRKADFQRRKAVYRSS